MRTVRDDMYICTWCANDVCICRWCADNMQILCRWHADVMIPGVVLHEIWHLREVCGWHADNMGMTYVCADDMQVMCGWHADDVQTTCVSADDMQMTPGVVLHYIWQLRQVCGWHVDDVWMTYVIRQWNLTQNLTLVSSARHLHIVCTSSTHHLYIVRTRLQPPKYFQLNTRATALLKSNENYAVKFKPFSTMEPSLSHYSERWDAHKIKICPTFFREPSSKLVLSLLFSAFVVSVLVILS